MKFLNTLFPKFKGFKQKVILSFIFGLIMCLFFQPKCFSQTDTSFWFGAPFNPERPAQLPISWPIVLRFFTASQPANVVVTQPANGGMPPQTISIPANSFGTLDLSNYLNDLEVYPADQILNKGIKIASDVPISCYYEVVSGGSSSSVYVFNSDIYPLKGEKALGTEFYVPFQNSHYQDSTRFSDLGPCGFIVVATKDNTEVQITPSRPAMGGHPAGTTFTKMLNKGQTFLVGAQFFAPEMRLSGTHVISDKPVAINTIDEAEGSLPPHNISEGSDMGGDQIVPITQLGLKYALYNFNMHGHGEPDELYVTATQNGTVVSLNGNSVANLNGGQTYYQAMPMGVSFIETSKPSAVWQLSGVLEQTGQSMVPSLDCGGGTNSVSVVRSIRGTDNFGNFTASSKIFLAIPDGAQDGFQINGNGNAITGLTFYPIPGTNGTWVYAQKLLDVISYPVGQKIKITNNQAKFVMGYLEGGNMAGTYTNYNASFAYFSDWDTTAKTILGLNPEINPNIVCEGQAVHFSVSAPSDPSWNSFHWEGPNGFSSDLPNPTIDNASAGDEGWYYVSIPSNLCVSGRDSIYLEVQANPTIMAYASPDLVCEGEDVQLIGAGSPDLTYNWSGPNGFSSGLQNPFLSNMATDMSGIYYLTADSINGCTSTVGVLVSVNEFPEFTLGNDTTICNGAKMTLQPDNGFPNGSYLWSTGAHDPNIIIQSGGTYSLTITRPPHCATTATIHVGTVDCDCHIFIPTAFTPNKDGMNDIWNPTENWGCVLTQYSLQVYNRWGQLVFTTTNPDQGWDGSYLGQKAELGVYFYSIRYTSFGSDVVGHEKGSVTLIR